MSADAALARVHAFVEAAALEAQEAIRRDFARLRAKHQLRRLMEPGKTYRLPKRFACPECEGVLLVEIDEWSDGDRRATQGGYRTLCEADEDAQLHAWYREAAAPDDHRYWFCDWSQVEQRVGRWLVRNVEVAES